MRNEGTEVVVIGMFLVIAGSTVLGYFWGHRRGEEEEHGLWIARTLALRQSIIICMEVRGDDLVYGKAVEKVIDGWVADDRTALMAMHTLDTLDGRGHDE